MDCRTPSLVHHLWFDGKHIKAGTQQRSNIFQCGRRGSAEPMGSSRAKNAPNAQQGLLQKGVTSICKASLRCSIGYCCEDSKSQGGTRGEILPSQVGIHAHGKKKILSSFPFLNSCCAGHDIWPKAAASRKQIDTSKA